jgi:phosphoribosylformylglycinamidine synthase
VKLGLLPDGEIKKLDEDSPTLTFNKIGRHVSNISKVKMASNLSPWFKDADFEAIYETPMSHGEGRFYANEDVLKKLIKNGQVATRYVDLQGETTMNGKYNPNGSVEAIEGITSKDGRIFGKMGHVERVYSDLLVNIYDKTDMKIFESGIKYFTHK